MSAVGKITNNGRSDWKSLVLLTVLCRRFLKGYVHKNTTERNVFSHFNFLSVQMYKQSYFRQDIRSIDKQAKPNQVFRTSEDGIICSLFPINRETECKHELKQWHTKDCGRKWVSGPVITCMQHHKPLSHPYFFIWLFQSLLKNSSQYIVMHWHEHESRKTSLFANRRFLIYL